MATLLAGPDPKELPADSFQEPDPATPAPTPTTQPVRPTGLGIPSQYTDPTVHNPYDKSQRIPLYCSETNQRSVSKRENRILNSLAERTCGAYTNCIAATCKYFTKHPVKMSGKKTSSTCEVEIASIESPNSSQMPSHSSLIL